MLAFALPALRPAAASHGHSSRAMGWQGTSFETRSSGARQHQWQAAQSLAGRLCKREAQAARGRLLVTLMAESAVEHMAHRGA